MWIGFTSEFVIGPYFYQEFDHNGDLATVTVNSERYLEMLQDFVVPRLEEMDMVDTVTFQQDGAPPHIGRDVTAYLRHVFGDRIISRGFPDAWPPRSPDLAPCDFWLWGYLKSIVYQNRPATLAQLRHEITVAVNSIIPDQLKAAVYHLPMRLQAVMDNGGGHIENILR